MRVGRASPALVGGWYVPSVPTRCAAADPTHPTQRAICVLQEKWVLHIVHALLDGPRGFNELGRDVGGCNPTTLRQRLVALQEVGLVARRSGEEGAARAVYALTPAGEGLRDVMQAIHTWSLQHLHSTRVPHPARPAQDEPARAQPTRRSGGPQAHDGAPIAAQAASGSPDGT